MRLNKEGYIKCENHEIYYRTIGNPDGIPVVFLHGGPGSNISDKSHSFFDLNKYYVILFDQRGCGKSKPRFSLENNNTFALVKDIENIRTFFGIDKWIVFGGSWGSTLSLVYAINHPNRVIALFLRGVFLGTKEEWRWLYQKGSDSFYSEYFDVFQNFVPVEYRDDNIAYYYKTLIGNDEKLKVKASFLWANWENINCNLNLPNDLDSNYEDNYQISLLESHYAYNNSFLEDDYILNNSDKIKDIKTYIFQGRYDLVCVPKYAYLLSKKLNNCELNFIKESGHSPFEKNMFEFITTTLNKFNIE